MASRIGFALPKALKNRDDKLWFKRLKVSAVPNDLDNEK